MVGSSKVTQEQVEELAARIVQVETTLIDERAAAATAASAATALGAGTGLGVDTRALGIFLVLTRGAFMCLLPFCLPACAHDAHQVMGSQIRLMVASHLAGLLLHSHRNSFRMHTATLFEVLVMRHWRRLPLRQVGD